MNLAGAEEQFAKMLIQLVVRSFAYLIRGASKMLMRMRATGHARMVRPCYGPLFPARASRSRNKGTVTWAQRMVTRMLKVEVRGAG